MRNTFFAFALLCALTATHAQAVVSRPEEVDPQNTYDWPGNDAGAWINAAIARLPRTGGEIYLAAGVYKVSTTIVIDKNVALRGAGRNFTTLNYLGSGDAIDMRAGTSAPYMNGSIMGITLVGNSATNAVGIHHIDTIGSLYDDLTVENFDGTNGTGIWFDNQVQFSERLSLRKLSVYRNTVGWRFSNSSSKPENSNSFSYWRVSEVHFQIAANQTAILANGVGLIGGITPSIFILNGDLGISANEEAASSKLITLANGAAYGGYHFDVFAECTGCESKGTGFTVDRDSSMSCDGHITLDGIDNKISGTYAFQPQSAETTGNGALVFNRNPSLIDSSLTNPDFYQKTSVKALGTATSGKNYDSSSLRFEGSYWTGAAAATDEWSIANILGTGANPASSISLDHQGTAGPVSVEVPALRAGNLSGNGSRCLHSDSLGNVSATYADCVLSGSLITTASISDTVPVTGMTHAGHCLISATNAEAAANMSSTFISAKGQNQLTVSHIAAAGLTFDILCSPN